MAWLLLIMDFIPYLWILIGVILSGLELLTPGFVVIFFGIGAVITGLLSLIIPGMNTNILAQFITWIASSFLSLGIFRKFFKKVFMGKEISDDGTDEYVGQTATVTEPVTEKKPGRVTFHGTTWKAITFDQACEPGDIVEIMKKDNLTLIVSKRD
ncbi:MAG: NfeD family protein [Spirochaetaceae bacterium]|nr:MAG: NfeD family protein [Spirochaetaceae bacterium]